MEQIIPQIIQVLLGAGVAGAVLAYHLLKLEPRLRDIEAAIMMKTKADLLLLASSMHVAPELKEAAKIFLDEIAKRSEKK